MLYVNVQGRLGNQLFQYAFAKHLRNNFFPGEKICFNFSKLEASNKQENGFENSLKYFKVNDLNVVNKTNSSFIQYITLYIYLSFKKLITMLFNYTPMQRYHFETKFLKLLNFFGIYCISNGYYEFKGSKFRNKIVIGNFESDKYFNDIREELLNEYKPKKQKLKENLNLYKNIQNSESVCVTIRRGDFLSDKYKSTFFVCDEKYFERAIKKMKSIVPNAKFFIFSDDIDWCRKNIKVPKGTMFESGKDPVWEKLRLMYSCKHFIISNSTFSWWAQYLSNNSDKVVIAPKKWKNADMPRDIYQDNWILM